MTRPEFGKREGGRNLRLPMTSTTSPSAREHRLQISDLLARPGSSRREEGFVEVEAALADASVNDRVSFAVDLRSTTDGVVARGTAHAVFDVRCSSCLTEWAEEVDIPVEAVYRHHPRDEDELPIEPGGRIDIGSVVHDEVSLALPVAPRCGSTCRGLCPTCGTDLNTDPCDGHEEAVESPFAALRELFDGPTPESITDSQSSKYR